MILFPLIKKFLIKGMKILRVYDKIRIYIAEQNIDENAVALQAGIPPAVFKKMLNGQRKIYSDDYKAICEALDVGAETFLDVKLA